MVLNAFFLFQLSLSTKWVQSKRPNAKSKQNLRDILDFFSIWIQPQETIIYIITDSFSRSDNGKLKITFLSLP